MSKIFSSVFIASLLVWSGTAFSQNFMFPSSEKTTVEGPVMPPISAGILSPDQFANQVSKINSQNDAAFKQDLNKQLSKVQPVGQDSGSSTPPPVEQSAPPPAATPTTQTTTPPPASTTPSSGPAGTFQQPGNKSEQQNSGGGWNIKY